MTKGEAAGQTPAVAPPPLNPNFSKATSSLWRSYLWEALPAESLRFSDKDAVPDAYQRNEWRPFFISADFQLTHGARELLDRLGKLEGDGIDPKPYELPSINKGIQDVEQLRLALKTIDPGFRDTQAESRQATAPNGRPAQPSPAPKSQYAMNSPDIPPPAPVENNERDRIFGEVFRATSALDVKLARNFTRFAQEMNPFSREDQIKALLGEVEMSELLERLEPPTYDVLRETYHKYMRLAEKTPKPELIADGPSIRPGETGSRIRSVQTRLQLEGYYAGKITGTYDAATLEAVKLFQKLHLLDSDGVVGAQTRQWLNQSFGETARMVATSMKLLRKSDTRPYENDRFVRINIPQFTLEYHKNGKVEAAHRIIVGKAAGKKVKLSGRWMGENQTPSFSSAIEQVVINPRWYVSDRIRRELNDEIAADPGYLSRLGYVRMSSQYPWGEPRLFQLPGPNNPLGQVKFEFPNAYAVFLHDTPKKHLFNRARRDFSHGCMRLEKAREFAELLLADDQSSFVGRTQTYLESTRQAFIKLQQPVPIIVEYIPVLPNEKGQVIFCGDLYQWFREDPTKKKS